MTIYYTFIDDTVGTGSSTVLGIQTNGSTHGVSISEDINCRNINSGIITTSSINVSGIVTATGGFISSASTTPIKINLIGNKIIFSVSGIGSTSLTLF